MDEALDFIQFLQLVLHCFYVPICDLKISKTEPLKPFSGTNPSPPLLIIFNFYFLNTIICIFYSTIVCYYISTHLLYF